MNGELHQLLLLAANANRYLHMNEYRPLDGFGDHQVFNLAFYDQDGHSISTVLKTNPVKSWIKDLKKRVCRGVLVIQADTAGKERESSGFIGGGRRWIMVARFDGFDEHWSAHWQLGQRAPTTRWDIDYRCRRTTSIAIDPNTYNLDESKRRLEQALTNIGQLAHEIGEEHWKVNFFDAALGILEGSTSFKRELPESYSEQAQRVFAAVYRCWVFGGMGSWNDVPPYSAHEHGKSAEFDAYSDILYNAMQNALEAAVNEAAVIRYGESK
ncbi:hypothetical protein [Saccharibacillus endophyticus]|uniref:Uncharacterized protein n=1 Tax=Saccharibacillus endophyticus TaxID=2060666 RepID=A0ABQ1ZKG4_9BACL|nr:hypothetical protein [Saccharibacillus endophyticus]GGH68646.1 hypothetical protein GCM10007362_02870 [Saccharibacillus endophyticus]